MQGPERANCASPRRSFAVVEPASGSWRRGSADSKSGVAESEGQEVAAVISASPATNPYRDFWESPARCCRVIKRLSWQRCRRARPLISPTTLGGRPEERFLRGTSGAPNFLQKRPFLAFALLELIRADGASSSSLPQLISWCIRPSSRWSTGHGTKCRTRKHA